MYKMNSSRPNHQLLSVVLLLISIQAVVSQTTSEQSTTPSEHPCTCSVSNCLVNSTYDEQEEQITCTHQNGSILTMCCNITDTELTSDRCDREYEKEVCMNTNGTTGSYSTTTGQVVTTVCSNTVFDILGGDCEKPTVRFYSIVIVVPLVLLALILVPTICCCKRKKTCCFKADLENNNTNQPPSKDEVDTKLNKQGGLQRQLTKPNDYTKPAGSQPERVQSVVYDSLPTADDPQVDYENCELVPQAVYGNDDVIQISGTTEKETAVDEDTQQVYGNMEIIKKYSEPQPPEENYMDMDMSNQHSTADDNQTTYQGPAETPKSSKARPVISPKPSLPNPTQQPGANLVDALKNLAHQENIRRQKTVKPRVAKRPDETNPDEEEYSDVTTPQMHYLPPTGASAEEQYYADNLQPAVDYGSPQRLSDENIYENYTPKK